jgi:predicted small secreted protein
MRLIKFTLALALTVAPCAFSQTAGQDIKKAGHDAKGAAANTGRATSHAARTTGSKIKHGTHKAANKIARKTQ